MEDTILLIINFNGNIIFMFSDILRLSATGREYDMAKMQRKNQLGNHKPGSIYLSTVALLIIKERRFDVKVTLPRNFLSR